MPSTHSLSISRQQLRSLMDRPRYGLREASLVLVEPVRCCSWLLVPHFCPWAPGQRVRPVFERQVHLICSGFCFSAEGSGLGMPWPKPLLPPSGPGGDSLIPDLRRWPSLGA